MRIWLVLCVLASAALGGFQVMTQRTQSSTVVVGPTTLSITEHDLEMEVIGEPELRYAFEIDQLIEKMRPGDKAELRRTTSKLPWLGRRSFEVVSVQRSGSPASVRKYGATEFYLVFAAITAAPLFLWSVVFLLTRSSPAKS